MYLLISFLKRVPLWDATGRQREEDGKKFVCDKRDWAIACEFCRDLHLT